MTRAAERMEGLRIVGQAGVGFPPPPTSYARAAYGGPQPSAEAATWLAVGPDGNVSAFAGKVEYGQGIRSGLAMEVADELRVPLDAVEVVLGDTDRTPWDMGTFGSQSTARVGVQLRKAAATARETLLELAANELDLPAGEIVCSDGRVSSRSDPGRTLTYSELLRGKSPFGLRHELAQHFEMDEANVRVIAPEIGGGFGSKSLYPVALEAARLAQLAGRPVRVAYTRNEEMVWSTFRPAALIQIKSSFKSDGRIVAWEYRAYHAGERPFIGRRGSETPYDTPNVNVTVFTSDSPLPTGSYRSLGGAVNHFARESHIDEIAVTTGIDPVELRLRNLSHPRFRRVLETAAARFGWTRTSAR